MITHLKYEFSLTLSEIIAIRKILILINKLNIKILYKYKQENFN